MNKQGQATLTVANLPVGSNVITAVFAATTSLLSSTSEPLTQSVSKSQSDTGTITSSLTQAYYGQNVVLTASFQATPAGAGPMTGTVAFYDGNTYLGTAVLNGSVTPGIRHATIRFNSLIPSTVYGSGTVADLEPDRRQS